MIRVLLALLIAGFTSSLSLSLAAEPDGKGFFIYVKGNKSTKTFNITGQISAVHEEGGKAGPLKNAPLYLIGPTSGERKNTVYQWCKTDKNGRYSAKVSVPGSYKIFLDPGWAQSHNIKSLSIRGGQVLVDDEIQVEPFHEQVLAAKPKGYIIREKVTFINSDNREIPLEGVVIYIQGPLPLSPTSPNTMLSVRTDALGYYVAKVKAPGTYEVSLDIPSAQHKGASFWTPNSYRILVE